MALMVTSNVVGLVIPLMVRSPTNFNFPLPASDSSTILIEVDAMSIRTPDLDDVFLSLTGHAGTQNGAAR